MKRTLVFSIGLLLAGCQTQGSSSGELLFSNASGSELNAVGPDSLGAGRHNTPNHFQDPNLGKNGLADPTQVQVQVQSVGSPEAVASLHGCTKLTYATLGAVLTSLGVDVTNTTMGSAGELYTDGATALGIAIYPGRTPEALFGTTASLTKQADIFVAAAQEILSNTTPMPSCPGTALLDSVGNFTADGISCVIGKPATQDYVALANQLITDAPDQATGQQLALASLLEAAHTCE
jgi:hypothetical protein